MKRSEAKRLREIIEEAVQSLDDEIAMEAIVLFPEVTDDTEVVKGKRYRHNGKLKKAKKDKQKKEKKNFEDLDEWEEVKGNKDKDKDKEKDKDKDKKGE